MIINLKFTFQISKFIVLWVGDVRGTQWTNKIDKDKIRGGSHYLVLW
jgi:hypothetical protein